MSMVEDPSSPLWPYGKEDRDGFFSVFVEKDKTRLKSDGSFLTPLERSKKELMCK